MKTYNYFSNASRPLLAALIDPDKATKEYLDQLASYAKEGKIDLFLVGGSLNVGQQLHSVVDFLTNCSEVPVVLFPGDHAQIDKRADAIMVLSLISGRNPEYLIGQQVKAALTINQTQLETIPTGYILIGSNQSTTAYITNTQPIPAGKPDLVLATALAGKQMGQRLLYLEGGSGTNQPVSPQMAELIKRECGLPIFVGGGISSTDQVEALAKVGTDVIVVGNAFEKSPELIPVFHQCLQKFHSTAPQQ